MYSTLKTIAITTTAAALLALAAGGCQQRVSEPEELNRTPLVVDDAMQVRDWPQSVVYYPSGAVVAGPNYLLVDPVEHQYSDAAAGALETPLFLGQVAWMPVAMVINPPWSEEVYRPVRYEPTYTAQPPLRTTD